MLKPRISSVTEHPHSVYWLISASQNLRAAVHADASRDPAAFESWQRNINAVLADVFPAQVVLVRDQFFGYRPFDGLAILLVEVQPREAAPNGQFPSPGTYIVKLAFGERLADLERELQSWDAARPQFLRSDSVFVSLDPFPPRASGQPPQALVYGDATAALGQRNILSLEEAVLRSCRFGQPRPDSIVRLLSLLYERCDTYFYQRSCLSSPQDYLAQSSRPRLTDTLLRWREPLATGRDDPLAAAPSVAAEPNDENRRRIRREILALLENDHAVYADPIDYLTGLWETPHQAPQLLRGYSHGDLHARNVQVAVLHDEVQGCAVFDYEKMRSNNFLAWDFIKMEIELAVRLLDEDGPASFPKYVRQVCDFWRFIASRIDDFDEHPPGADTDGFSQKDVPRLLPRDPRLAAQVQHWPASLYRMAKELIWLRRIAHRNLGANRGRGFDWIKEYDFLATWYAARAGLYPNHNERMVAAALVAAGVSARRLLPADPPSSSLVRATGETGHRPRFLSARGEMRSDDVRRRDNGVAALEALRGDYPHVLEIKEELALGYIEQQKFTAAEKLLSEIETRYHYTTSETPARLGRLWKDRAVASQPLDRMALRQSLTQYRMAEQIGGDYFPAINVASLLLLLGERAAARQQAQRVIEMLNDHDGTDDPFWPYATRGEAELLLGGEIETALQHYRRALADRDCLYRDRVSMRRQLELLRPHLDTPLQSALTDDVLNRLFSSPSQEE